MRSDDDLLAHVRREAGVRRAHRQRALVGVAAVVALALGLAALATVGGGGDGQQVMTDDGGRSGPTTTLDDGPSDDPAPTDAVVVPGPTTTVTEPVPVDPSTTTTVPVVPETTTTTAPAPIRPYSMTRVGDGITLTAEALQQRDRPGVVELVVTISAERGSGPGGRVGWGDGGDEELFGTSAEGPMDCAELIDDDPATDVGPDGRAGPVEQTFRLTHTYAEVGSTIELTVAAVTSFCTSDEARVSLGFPVDIGG